MKKHFLLLFVMTSGILFGQNQAPEITNLTLTLSGSDVLRIAYDLSDFENDEVLISLRVKKSDGSTFNIQTQNASGDLNIVTPGIGKTIEWNYAGELNSTGEYTIRLVAEDNGMVDIQSIVDQVDSNNLKRDLAFIEGRRHRTAGADHLQATRDFIEQRFVDYGLQSTIQTFDYNSWTGENYIGTKPGTTQEANIYICDAHYDSISSSPGADDNGSGVVGFIEAARILSNYNFKKTIKFIGFDLEEEGLKGSFAYVTENISDEETIAGVLNFEMIGYATEEPNTQTLPNGFNLLFPNEYAALQNDGFRGNFIGNFGLEPQSDWALDFENAAAQFVPDLKVTTFLAPQNWPIIAPDLGRSDHAPFWLAGYPAVMLSGTANFRNPNYHTPYDTLGTLNFTFMSNVVKAAVATLAEAAEIHNSSFVEETINITATSVDETPFFEFTIRPNPVSDVLRFTSSSSTVKSTVVEIYNLYGQLLFEQEIRNIHGAYNLDLKDWQNCVYLLKTNTSPMVKRFVIQH